MLILVRMSLNAVTDVREIADQLYHPSPPLEEQSDLQYQAHQGKRKWCVV